MNNLKQCIRYIGISLCLIGPLFSTTTWAETSLSMRSNTKAPLAVTSIEKLGTNDQGVGLIPGTAVEDFTIQSHTGEDISFADLKAKAPLLVVFYRGGWCPYCNIQIRQLTEAYSQFADRDVLPVLISVDQPDGAAAAQSTYEIPFPVLSDPDLAAHTVFDVVMSVDDATAERYGYTDLMVDGAPLPHQPDTIIRWLIDRLRS